MLALRSSGSRSYRHKSTSSFSFKLEKVGRYLGTARCQANAHLSASIRLRSFDKEGGLTCTPALPVVCLLMTVDVEAPALSAPNVTLAEMSSGRRSCAHTRTIRAGHQAW